MTIIGNCALLVFWNIRTILIDNFGIFLFRTKNIFVLYSLHKKPWDIWCSILRSRLVHTNYNIFLYHHHLERHLHFDRNQRILCKSTLSAMDEWILLENLWQRYQDGDYMLCSEFLYIVHTFCLKKCFETRCIRVDQ